MQKQWKMQRQIKAKKQTQGRGTERSSMRLSSRLGRLIKNQSWTGNGDCVHSLHANLRSLHFTGGQWEATEGVEQGYTDQIADTD